MTRPNYTFSSAGAPAAVPLAGSACVLAVGLLAWPYTVDDAFISARYARNLAAGLGYAMNPGQSSDGVTGPLWLLPQIAAALLHIDPIATAKALGLACTTFAAWIVLRRLRARAGGRAASSAAAVVLATSPSLGTWAVAGLETGLATALVAIAALAATRRRRPSAIALGMCSAALAWLRPELAIACGGLLAAALLRDRRAGITAVAVAAAGAVSVIAFRLALFDEALPLSVRAKPASLANGFAYATTAVVLATSLVGVGLAIAGARRGQRLERVFALAMLAHVLAIALAGGDWMPGYRLLVPVIPLYAVVSGVGAARAFARRPGLGALCVGLACALPAVDLATRLPELRQNAAHRRALEPLARALAQHARVVALLDVGYLGYASGVEIVDLGGLTDDAIARRPGGHLDKRVDEAYLRARAPDAIVLHSARAPRVGAGGELLAFDGYPVERRVAAMRFVREEFRVATVVRYAPDYHYVVLARVPSPLRSAMIAEAAKR